ncbi:MAG: hypothetical protein AB8I08_38355 [Sandaracinaceae bacterium]
MRRLSTPIALLGALALLAVGCGDPQPPINRVGVNVVEKSAFDGSWYMHTTIIDMEYEGAPTGFVGANGGDDTAGFLGVAIPRVRWVIDEDFLYAYRDYEIVGDPEDPFNVRGDDDEDYLGQPVAAYRIESHFDIRREYNTVTGEERNVVVENMADRHWYERQFMRVDWSQNLVSPAFTSGGGFTQGESVSLFVQDASNFPSAWRPQFHFMACDGLEDENCDPGEHDYAGDYDQGDMYSMSFVSQGLISPTSTACRWSDEIRAQFSFLPECATVQMFIRTSFLRVSDRREYAPVAWDHDRFNRAGYFAYDRITYDRSNRAGDPSFGVTDFTNQSANRHNIWRNWYQRDAAGEIMTDDNGQPMLTPYAERETREIVWYTSSEVPAHLVKPSYELVAEWNAVFMNTARQLQGRESPLYATVSCQDEDPGGYCFCQEDPTTGDILNATCAGRYDPFVPPAEASMARGEAYDCYVVGFDADGNEVNPLTFEPDYSNPGLSDSDFNGWLNTEMRGSECINVLRMNTCHVGNIDEHEQLDCQERGDIRWKLLSFVNQPGTPFLGVAQMRGDPLTGEIITGDANIGGPAMDSQRTSALEAYDLINGNIAEQEYYTGEDVRAFLNAVQHVELPAPPRIDFSAALREGVAVDPGVRAGIQGVMESAMVRAEQLRGPEGRAAVFTDRLRELAGTDIESRLVAGADGFTAGNQDFLPPGVDMNSPSEAMMDDISPFRFDFEERYLQAQDQMLREGLQNYLAPNEYTDASVLNFVNEHRDWTRVRVEFELNRRLYRDTQVHEMGHCLGLRHHFGGTADPGNYFDGYYTINEQYPLPDPNTFNTDGVPGLSPAEQIAFEDAYDTANERRELAGIDQWMNSSVMDYTPNWYQRINGAGYHDYMAISFGYGDVVDIYDNSLAADGTARSALPADQLTPVNTMRRSIKYYHGGETCSVDTDCPFSSAGSRSGELLATNMASGLTQTCITAGRDGGNNVCSNFDEDARGLLESGATAWVPIDYFYCEDIRSSTRSLPGCAVFDEGDSFREIVRNQTESYERSYIFSAFRRYRLNFTIGGYFNRLVRYLDPLLGIYGNLIYRYSADPEFRNQEGPFGFEDQFLATADTMNFMARLLAQPSIGSYEYNAAWDRYELSSLEIQPDAQVAVEFGQGRYLNSIYQTGLTGINRVERIGSIYDSILAMQLMTARGLTPFYGPDVIFQTNFYDIFPNEIQQIFTGMIAGQPEQYMPRLQCAPGSVAPNCDDARVVYMDFYRGDCSIDPDTGEPRTATCRPNPADVTYRDLGVLNGGTRFFLQSYAAIFSLQSFPVYYDTTYQNQMYVCVEGQGDCFDPEDGSVEGVDFVRHTSRRFGKSFLAWQVDSSEGVAEQTSIAFSMVKEARDADFVIRMLRKYRGDGLPGDPAPSIDNLTPDEQAALAALEYEIPDSDSQIQFEIDRLDGRLNSLEGFFFYIVQLERAFGIEFPALYRRTEI